jgi:biotin carboxylase
MNQTKKKIAILGASYLQKSLVEKAIDMGLETHVFAWDNDEAVCKNIANFFYPISVLEKKEIYEVCKGVNIDAITTIATDICVPTISFVAEKLGLISNSYLTALNCTNKAKMREVFFENEVKSPKYIVKTNNDIVKINLNYPVIVKPTDRSGSRGVCKVNKETDLKKTINRGLLESIEKKVIIEEYVEGDEVSVEAISWKGQHFVLAITDKVTTGPPYFVELEHHQPSQLNKEIQEKITRNVLKALDALNVEYGASHSEFKITPSGDVFIIEVGARMGGDFIGSHLVELSTGYDYLKAVINISLGKFNMPVNLANNFAGVYFLSKETEYLMPYFLKDNLFVIEKKVTRKQLKNIVSSNERSGYIIYQGAKKINFN